MGVHVDEIDRRILYHLVRDARNTTAPQIAERVDVTPATIRNRITQLEERDIIQGYHASLDYERSEGLTKVEIACTAPAAKRQQFGKKCAGISGVIHIRELTTGNENLRITAVCTDSDDITRLVRELSGLGLVVERQSIIHSEFTQPYQRFAPDEGEQTASLTDFRSLSGGAEVVEFTVSDEAPIAGQSLADAHDAGLLPEEVLVISLERGATIEAPKGDTTVQAGDIVTVFARNSLPEETYNAFAARNGPHSHQ